MELLEGIQPERDLVKSIQDKDISIKDLERLYKVGSDFYLNYQFKEAEIVFGSYMALNPYDHRGSASLAAIYLELCEFRKALDILSVVKTFPTCHLDETYLNLSLCHYKLKEYLDACAMLRIVKRENLTEYYTKRFDYLERQLSPYIKRS
ncbi:regulator [Vibrio coralliilyticus]|nr:regulator [Vibrio coralliilyticus]